MFSLVGCGQRSLRTGRTLRVSFFAPCSAPPATFLTLFSHGSSVHSAHYVFLHNVRDFSPDRLSWYAASNLPIDGDSY